MRASPPIYCTVVLKIAAAFSAFAASASDRGDTFTDEEPITLELGGATREVESWHQGKWNGQALSVTNGTLVFTKSVAVHGGRINIGPDATLRFARGCSLGTGLGDAGTRVFDVAPGGRLDMDGVKWNMDYTRVLLPRGAEWNADLTRLELAGAMKDNLWDISGHASFPRGIRAAKGETCVEEVMVSRPGKVVLQPAPNELVLVGQCGYGPATNLVRDILKDDLCNLYVGWHSASKTHPEKVPEDIRDDWVKANPRDRGTPETKIAMALGNLDAYLGQDGGFTVWSQHDNAAKNPTLWKYGAPEKTQALLEDIFFPRPKDLLAPFGNTWLGGTPYGQVDVMQMDDDSTLADLRRYDLLVFGGWNTMTPHVKDVLERYVMSGGTLVMSRPELTTRIDRDFLGYADGDLLAPFGFLPPEGGDAAFAEKRFGKGRYFLFTGRKFPSASQEGRVAYAALVRRLASEVRQTVRLCDGNEANAYICYGVYPRTIYFLNTDTAKERSFVYECDFRRMLLTLGPCEIRAIPRQSKARSLREPFGRAGRPRPAAMGGQALVASRKEQQACNNEVCK